MNFRAYIVSMVFLCHHNLAKGEFFFEEVLNEIIEPVIQQVEEGLEEVLEHFTRTFELISSVTDESSFTGRLHIPKEKEFDNIVAEYMNGVSNKDAKLSIADLILKYGFPLEIHNVETDDGYILKMYRIANKTGPAVFLMHGLLGSADDYIVSGPKSGLAYLLAREGYDVWMGNARGNKHSRIHKNLCPSQKKFWDFSWHETGIFDLPAMLDYVLKETSSKKLKYIGHSQGTTAFFVMASERPEYNDKISIMVALSPVAFMSNMESPVLRLLAPSSPLIYFGLNILGVHEFAPDNLLTRNLKRAVCEINVVTEILCSNAVFLIVGFDVDQMNVTNLPVILGHSPSGASTKQITHYGQEIISGNFAKFDYGSKKNKKVYGKRMPPEYELKKVTAPVALFYSDADLLAHPKDVRKLSQKLGNVVEMYKVPNNNFNHLDFVLAKDLKTLIYDRLQYILKQF